jgi:CheY-like chemotaxis protein
MSGSLLSLASKYFNKKWLTAGADCSTGSSTLTFNFRILVVDDEPSVRDTSAAILAAKGYEVRTAQDGFEALAELTRSLPDLIISDLRMPNMSGFELLSVVRRRFPHIAVIAISGEYHGLTPEGLIADAFFTKGQYSIQELFQKIADLVENSPLRPNLAKPDTAPVWIPLSAEGYFVITCTECLRSSSVPIEMSTGEMRESRCIFCDSKIRFLADVEAEKKKIRAAG